MVKACKWARKCKWCEKKACWVDEAFHGHCSNVRGTGFCKEVEVEL